MPRDNGYQVRVWDPEVKAWVLHTFRDDEEAAKSVGRVLWKAGAAGVRISVWEERVVTEHKR